MNEISLTGLKGKRVLITGASGAIGSITAELFGRAGAITGIHYYKNRHAAVKILKKIEAANGKAILVKADLLNFRQTSVLIDKFCEEAGGIDILVNCAGGFSKPANFETLDTKAWHNVLDLNLGSVFFLMREAFLRMKVKKFGRIINISSVAAKYGGSPLTAHYGAAKAAVENLTIFFSRVGAPYNILVNCVRPGVIATELHNKFRTENQMKQRISLIPLKRAGTTYDIAMMILFLSSDAGSFITGQIIPVSGGE